MSKLTDQTTLATVAANDKVYIVDVSDTTDSAQGSSRQMTVDNLLKAQPIYLQFALSDELTALTAGTGKLTFRMPFAMTLTDVRLSVLTAPTGAAILVDVNEGGSTIFSTRPSIAISSKTSVGGTPAVISDAALADDAEITVDIDQVGSTIAGVGLKLTLIGYRA